ncbi:response regulator [Azonexus hydrophilus]|uniref:Response regulator n=1 Tax=Azonexus hydrophilus TaxID=418702 RepID=A0A1R1I0F0_9RHOO|nr:response regulator [Azonexus hydrophilus]OMG52139.1 response regulator [Azonexus hydrophilus]
MTERLALIVDDHPTNRLIAVALLRKLGWQTHEADSGAGALELAGRHAFRLVLLDISMPGLTGEETCKALREQVHGNALRIIAYTAHAFPEERTRFLAAGFDDILVKPINRERLEALIENI